MAYRLLSLTAISGEFPTDQLNRLPGSPYYLESVVTALKKDGLLFVVGSLYLVGEIKDYVRRRVHD